ncbi:hypothetical protein [Peterkaempfera bronchialis]|uniref:hypothetical protein n=1 Tax=Peterkaempfera bronchialis TaxID=2126346 RepID=UPI0013B45CFD|nr:hypothetical protein [Peterkaempfera bronchialis]
MTAAEQPGSPPADETPRSRLAAELRSAYENGARVKDLAVVSHRAQSEVRRLLREAGAVLGGGARRRPVRWTLPAPGAGTRAAVGGAGTERASGPPKLPRMPKLVEPPGLPDTPEPPVGRRRVPARVVRVGVETCFVVLPEWRAAIAVPVATEVLLTATGLPYGELSGAELTVLARLEALHDRELAVADWQLAGQSRGTGLS